MQVFDNQIDPNMVNVNETDPLKIDKIVNPMLRWYACTIFTNFHK